MKRNKIKLDAEQKLLEVEQYPLAIKETMLFIFILIISIYLY
jgi:hypothetical protein